MAILKDIATDIEDPDGIHYQMLREMLHVEQSYRGAYRRHGIFDVLEKTLKQHAFTNEADALAYKLSEELPKPPEMNDLTEDMLSETLIEPTQLQITQ